jgi:hypothetical protein
MKGENAMVRLILAAGALAVLAGCAQMAPTYNPAVENVQVLRDSGAGKARVSPFDPKLTQGQSDTLISLRASGMESPYGGKFSSYITEALKSELTAARLLDDKSTVEITGIITKNDVSVGNMVEGYGEIEARVMVKNGGESRYDKVKYAKVTFETGFAGFVAIPAGVRAYPLVVQKFLAELYADPDFIRALK